MPAMVSQPSESAKQNLLYSVDHSEEIIEKQETLVKQLLVDLSDVAAAAGEESVHSPVGEVGEKSSAS